MIPLPDGRSPRATSPHARSARACTHRRSDSLTNDVARHRSRPERSNQRGTARRRHARRSRASLRPRRGARRPRNGACRASDIARGGRSSTSTRARRASRPGATRTREKKFFSRAWRRARRLDGDGDVVRAKIDRTPMTSRARDVFIWASCAVARDATPSGGDLNGKGVAPDRVVACGVAERASSCAGR